MLPWALSTLAIVLVTSMSPPAAANPVIVPFDFSRSAIGVEVTIRGIPLYMIVDTGVDPSIIDLNRADVLGLKVDRTNSGDATGFGEGKGQSVFPSSIDHLVLGGHTFAPFDALASDMTGISTSYGRKIDGVLGYSFLSDKLVLIDYPEHRLGIFNKAGDTGAIMNACHKRWSTPLGNVDNFPVISNFRFGAITAPVSFDTGSNGGIAFFKSALELKSIRTSLTEKGTIIHVGARGETKTKSYTFDASVGMGPFALSPGQIVSLHNEEGSADTRIANVGNALFADMKLKVLLDYPAKTITVFGDCR